MTNADNDALLRSAAEMLGRHTAALERAEIDAFVQPYLDRRDTFLAIAAEHGSPLYVIEEAVLAHRARQFTEVFRAHLPNVRVYYAVKTNNHPAVADAVVKAGLGLDVSSGLELQLALDTGADDIVFSGPAKTDDELGLALEHRDRVTVLIDSFRELDRLQRLASEAGGPVRAGVRLTADERGLWRKFGIPLMELSRFIDTAARCSHVDLRGLQFHTSWNLDPSAQVGFIQRLGDTLAGMRPEQLVAVECLDVGGGFWPPQGEWLLPVATPEGKLREAIRPGATPQQARHRLPAQPIVEFARQISDAVKAHVFPHVRCRVCAEPGRWIVNDALHLVLTVADCKGDDIAITDGATNAIGWERFETDYFPVINLSQPELAERPCYVLGSLCTPHDVWGYAYYGAGIRPGDVLLIPTQGAYTYSLRQHFIKPLPRSVLLKTDGSVTCTRSL
ncbi:MAG: alanine racemase [Planctomycetota bacterium]